MTQLSKPRIVEGDPRGLTLLDVNARFMRHEQFHRLVANIREDGHLTSTPLVWHDSRLRAPHRPVREPPYEGGDRGRPVVDLLAGGRRPAAAAEADRPSALPQRHRGRRRPCHPQGPVRGAGRRVHAPVLGPGRQDPRSP
ncbi:hypothetical protein ACQ4WX_22040 [Streptomyces lasalocidi]